MLVLTMVAGLFGAVPLMAHAADEGYSYQELAVGRVNYSFVLAGSFGGGRINNVGLPLTSDVATFVWNSERELFEPAETSAEVIVGNFVQLRSTTNSSLASNLILVVPWQDSKTYWDSEMAWNDVFDDEGAFSGGQEWRLPYGERLFQNYRVDGAVVDYSNIVDYGDLENSTYWPQQDYFNTPSTDTLTMLTGFRTTQQNTGSTCGPTSALMVLDWFDLRGDLNEEDLSALRMKSSVRGSTNLQQEVNIFLSLNELSEMGIGEWGEWEILSSYDIVSEYGVTRPPGSKYNLMSVDELMDGTLIRDLLEAGVPIMIGWNSFGGHWQVIIGYDTMGSEDTRDHVLILADPYDTTDHNNDGYNVQSLERFVYDWSAGFDTDFRHGIFVAAWPKDWDYTPVYGDSLGYLDSYDGDDSDDMKLEYGRTAAAIERFYPDTPWRGDNGLAGAATGGYERVPNDYVNVSPYYAHYDFYNMSSGEGPDGSGGLIILEKFMTQQQATEWTCGLTSVLMAMEWYGANPSQPRLLNSYSDEELVTVAEEYGFDVFDLLDDRLTEIDLALLRGEGRTNPGATTLGDMKSVFDNLNADEDYLQALAVANGWDTIHKWEYLPANNTMSSITYEGVRHNLSDGAADGGVIPFFLSLGYPILIGWDEWGGHWQVIIGYDDMGTEDTQDDVLILADPYDTTDHNQDGYYLEAFERLVFGWGAAFNGSPSSNIYLIPYLVDTGVPIGELGDDVDIFLEGIVGALANDIVIADTSELADADDVVAVVVNHLGVLGYSIGIDYAISDAAVLVGEVSDFERLITGEVILAVRVRCGVLWQTVTVTVTGPFDLSVTTSPADFVSIVETAKNSNIWVLTFAVSITDVNGVVSRVTYSVPIQANNANVSGSYDCGLFTLVYDIKGNGSNIKKFEVLLN